MHGTIIHAQTFVERTNHSLAGAQDFSLSSGASSIVVDFHGFLVNINY